jgi:hypothetical protein
MKHRTGLILLCLLFLPYTTNAQSGPTLSGTVSEKGTGRPLLGAKVVVVGGKANPESTDSKGGFVLRFPAEVRVGDLIRIHIELDGCNPYTDTLAVAPAQPHSISLECIKNTSKTVTKPDAVRQPAASIVFKDQIPEVFTIELYRGSQAVISRKDLTEKGWGPFRMADEKPFSIYLDKGNLYAEARIYNGPGLPAVEVNKGDFVVRPMDWDRNFSDNALEIVNERMQPVLQIIYKRNGLIQIQGIFRGRNGGMIFEAPELPEALPRIFKYPSWKYQGQYAESADQDASPFARATDFEFVVFVKKWLEEPKRQLQYSNHNPALTQVVAQNLMTWFYEKGVLYRGELVRRLKDKGDEGTARLKTPPDSQAVLSLPHRDQIESMSKILADIENLAVRLETKRAEEFGNQPPISAESIRPHLQTRLVIDSIPQDADAEFHVEVENIGQLQINGLRAGMRTPEMTSQDVSMPLPPTLPPGGRLSIPGNPTSGLKRHGVLFLDLDYESKDGGNTNKFASRYSFLFRPADLKPQVLLPTTWQEEAGATLGPEQKTMEAALKTLAGPQGTILIALPLLRPDGSPNLVVMTNNKRKFSFDGSSRAISFTSTTSTGSLKTISHALPEGSYGAIVIGCLWDDQKDEAKLIISGKEFP